MEVLLIGSGQEVVAVWLSIIAILRPETGITTSDYPKTL